MRKTLTVSTRKTVVARFLVRAKDIEHRVVDRKLRETFEICSRVWLLRRRSNQCRRRQGGWPRHACRGASRPEHFMRETPKRSLFLRLSEVELVRGAKNLRDFLLCVDCRCRPPWILGIGPGRRDIVRGSTSWRCFAKPRTILSFLRPIPRIGVSGALPHLTASSVLMWRVCCVFRKATS